MPMKFKIWVLVDCWHQWRRELHSIIAHTSARYWYALLRGPRGTPAMRRAFQRWSERNPMNRAASEDVENAVQAYREAKIGSCTPEAFLRATVLNLSMEPARLKLDRGP